MIEKQKSVSTKILIKKNKNKRLQIMWSGFLGACHSKDTSLRNAYGVNGKEPNYSLTL